MSFVPVLVHLLSRTLALFLPTMTQSCHRLTNDPHSPTENHDQSAAAPRPMCQRSVRCGGAQSVGGVRTLVMQIAKHGLIDVSVVLERIL